MSATRRTCAVLGEILSLLVWFPVVASAQPAAGSFQELQVRIKIGDIVYVIDESGRETRGKVDMVSDDSLWLNVDGFRRDFVQDTVTRIDRRQRDSVRNGLLIGVGGGALLGFFAGRAADSPTCPRPGIECGQGPLLGTIGGAALGGIGGWVIDALTRHREVIYQAPPHPRIHATTAELLQDE